MTAIIGVLNKTTVALAADSAATVGPDGNSKIYNHANKIFNLTNDNPVGIAIYGLDEVMGVPWETIIKMYRKQFSSAGYKTLHEYGDSFIKFLHTLLIKHVSADEQTGIVRLIAQSIIREVNTSWKARIESDRASAANPLPVDSKLLTSQLLDVIKEVTKNISNRWKPLVQFTDYSLESFLSSYSNVILEEAKNVTKCTESEKEALPPSFTEIVLSQDHINLLNGLVHKMVAVEFFYEFTTGVVISGFGEDEIYPSLISYVIGGVVNDTVRYTTGANSTITKQMSADVVPFAQTDSIWAFLTGINPKMQERVVDVMSITLNQFSQRVLEKLQPFTVQASDGEEVQPPTGSEVTTHVLSKEQITKLEQEFTEAADNLLSNVNKEIQSAIIEDFFGPIVSTIVTLSKEDLAEMAESLINLTYLQRRMSFTPESVGGPVDVALITKGDGFVWVKRKHYFKPDLNLNYLARVLLNNGQPKTQLQ